MSTPYREPSSIAAAKASHDKPWLWGLRVWLYSMRVCRYADSDLRFVAEDANGTGCIVRVDWKDAESVATMLESTPPGQPALAGGFLIKPECVPTMARYARDAADAYARSKK